MTAAKQKKHTLRFERNAVSALCALVFLIFAGAAVAGWLAAPVPVGAVLTGVAAFVLLFTAVLSVSWIRYAGRFYAAAADENFPCAALGDNLSVVFMPCRPKKRRRICGKRAPCPPSPNAIRGKNGSNAATR